jgi:O-antigen/teichoic acid export membrane protein
MTPVWLKYLPAPLRRQLDSPLAQKLVGNTGWLFADKILRAVGELTVGIWIARYLGPEQFGMLNYAIAFVALFTPLYTLGLDKIVVRDIVQAPEQRETTLGSALGLRLVTGVLAAIAAIAAIMALRPGQTTLHWLVGLMAFGLIFQASDVVTFWFQSQIQAKQDVAARSSAYGVTTLARIGCILSRASLLTLGATYVLEPVIRSVGLGATYWRNQGFKQRWRFDIKRAKTLLRHSWPLMLSGVAIMIYMRIDQVMLGQLADDQAVGIYSAAVRLSEGWYFIPMAIASSAFPAILVAKQNSQAQYLSYMSRLFKIAVLVAYLIAFSMSLGSRQVITTLFGASYSDAAIVLSIHVWSGIFTSLGVISKLWMTAEDLMLFSFFATASGAIFNLVANHMLIPRYEAIGAAIATLFSYIFANLIICFTYDRTRPIAMVMLRSLVFAS